MEVSTVPSKPNVRTKEDFVERYIAGEFGNRPPTWGTLEEFEESNYHGLVHIRNRVIGAKTWYNVDSAFIREHWYNATQFYRENQLYISMMAPEKFKIFQGEVQRGIWGLDLYYNTVAAPMRDVPKEEWYSVSGIISACLLRGYLCPNSHEWLMYLLDTYPQHVVEFSTYSRNWGMVPGFNTAFWEVRKY